MLDFSQNHFELFGLEPGFRVDQSALAGRYRELQKVLHPDRFVTGSERERRLSVQSASLVNEAFRTLRDPLLRARYLLSLQGTGTDDNQTTTDAEFLMEQMELREELADVRTAVDPMSALAGVSAKVRERLVALTDELDKAFTDIGGEEGRARARDLVLRMQFMRKLKTEAENLEADLEDMI